jgi:hypothetical protein
MARIPQGKLGGLQHNPIELASMDSGLCTTEPTGDAKLHWQ